MIPVYITNRNLQHTTRALVEYLRGVPDCEPIIVDNASTYPALLDWYATAPCRIIRRDVNGGPRSAWSVMDPHRLGSYYVVTDSDLDLSRVPTDFLDVQREGLETYPDVCKVGLSLETTDLPDTPYCRRVAERQKRYHSDRRDGRFFNSEVATTLAMYRGGRKHCLYGPALRSELVLTAMRAGVHTIAAHDWRLNPNDVYGYLRLEPLAGYAIALDYQKGNGSRIWERCT